MMVLGLLISRPRHGYDLHRVVVSHGPFYTDFKKPTLYHLLNRLAEQGFVRAKSEGGARGNRGERLVYSITAEGRGRFQELLTAALCSAEPGRTGLEVAVVFLSRLPGAEARRLLVERRRRLAGRRAQVGAGAGALAELPPAQRMEAGFLAADHSLAMIDAELAWTERAIAHLEAFGARSSCTGSPRAGEEGAARVPEAIARRSSAGRG